MGESGEGLVGGFREHSESNSLVGLAAIGVGVQGAGGVAVVKVEVKDFGA